ncbi:hypothetical protein AVEN_16547-1 [Araneus ventricosus]|uniref:Uncharacterized protein n=1 Tax=Araneus ventricosus TaxID=182803 RepID=A0A4Y2SWN5_ARAVE|nr:hypothetical protein AVEN_16547-1 [Araneus ventricosus]
MTARCMLCAHSSGHGGLVQGSQLWCQRLSGSKPDSTEDLLFTSEDAKNEEHRDKTKHHYFHFNKSYKTDFHSAYPVTISGKDVLCSSDVSPDLLYLACGFESCKISTWRLCCEVLSLQCKDDFKLQPLGTLRGHKGIVYALSIDSNRKTLISGSHDCTVRIWDIEESTCMSEISAHSAPVYAVCVSPNSRYFLTASEDKHIVLFWYDEHIF